MRLTRAQREVLERMATKHEALTMTSLRSSPRGGTFGIRYAKYVPLVVTGVAPKQSWGKLLNAGLIRRVRGISFVYELTPAGRAALKGEANGE